MYRFSTSGEFFPDEFPDPLPAMEPVGLSGYLFFGTNSSFSGLPSQDRHLNLDGLPATFSSSGFDFIQYNSDQSHFDAPLATFLLCDPQIRVMDGRMLLSQLNSSLTLISALEPLEGKLKVGNIPLNSAESVLALGLVKVLTPNNHSASTMMGDFAAQAFLNDSSLDFVRTDDRPFDVGILSTEVIQSNLNSFTNFAAKGFSSFVRDYDLPEPGELFLVPVDAAIRHDESALKTSRGLLISTIGLFFAATIIMVIDIFCFDVWKTPAFTLESLLRIIDQHDGTGKKYVSS